MSVQQFNQVAYGLTQGLIDIFPAPIISNRAPLVQDHAQIGTIWINKLTDFAYILTAITANQANWEILIGGGGAFAQLTTNAGVVVPAAGNINLVGGGATNITTSGAGSTATVAVITSPSFAGTTTVATGLTATTGNIVASTGNINATLGNIDAGNDITAGQDITATGGDITAVVGNIETLTGAIVSNTTVTAGTVLVGTTGLTVSSFTEGVVQSNNLGTFSSTEGIDGEILISSTAGAPAWATITAGTNVTVTNGANSITIGASSEVTIPNFVSTAVTPYVATATDYFISIDASGGAKTVQLPNAPTALRAFIIKDQNGNAGANTITVTTVGGVVLIDGLTSQVINNNYETLELMFNGTAYEVF